MYCFTTNYKFQTLNADLEVWGSFQMVCKGFRLCLLLLMCCNIRSEFIKNILHWLFQMTVLAVLSLAVDVKIVLTSVDYNCARSFVWV